MANSAKSGRTENLTSEPKISTTTNEIQLQTETSVQEQLQTLNSNVSKYAGRLRHFIEIWKEITTDQVIISWLKGYKIPFDIPPKQFHIPKERGMSKIECQNTKRCVDKLLKMGAISKCKPVKDQFISSIFLVPKPDGSHRLILNLKNLNKFITPQHFKMEDRKTVLNLISHKCFMATVDLKDAYLLIPIDKNYKKYLRFQFNNQLYEYCCLPFGLCTAPLVFTKIIRPIVANLRSKGFLSVVYIDDFLLLGDTFQDCKKNIKTTCKLLERLGFIIGKSKSKMVPSTSCKFLGFLYDSVGMKIQLTIERKLKVLNMIRKLKKQSVIKIREFAQFLGVLVSICPAMKYAWLYTKLLEREKFLTLRKNQGDYDQVLTITAELRIDLHWWETKIMTSSNPIKQDGYVLEIFSDASLSGWGAVTNDNKSHGFWSENEKKFHINRLELLAAFFGLKCFAKNLRDCNILLRIDNTTAVSYINRMGGIRFTELNGQARQLWQWCEDRNIFIFASYIKSADNLEADVESRRNRTETEWELADFAFKQVVQQFGQPQIDLFASRMNAKCKTFVSWGPDPEAYAVDAFTLRWQALSFYAFPPFSIIARVLRKIINDEAEGIVVVPLWPAQPWYPMFTSLLIAEPVYFPPSSNLLFSPDRQQHLLSTKLTLVAAKLSGKPTSKKEFQMRQ